MGNYVRYLGRSQRNLRVSPGSTGSTSSTRARNRRADAHSGPHPQRRPKRRPPLPKPPKYSHCGRGGLRFGQIAGEGHPHQHATVDTTLTTEWTAPHPSARSDCRRYLGDTTPVPPTATRTHRLLTARIRIGYEDMDRLLTYPDADNLSTSDTDTRATLTSEPPSKPRRAARHNDLLKLQTTSAKTSKNSHCGRGGLRFGTSMSSRCQLPSNNVSRTHSRASADHVHLRSAMCARPRAR